MTGISEWVEAVAAVVILLWSMFVLNDMRGRGAAAYTLAVIAAGIWAGTFLILYLVDLDHPEQNPEILLMALVVMLDHGHTANLKK